MNLLLLWTDEQRADTLRDHLAGRHHVLVSPDRWRLVASEFGERELYDLDSDPWELFNLAHQPQHSGLRRELEDRLVAWQQASGDECPL